MSHANASPTGTSLAPPVPALPRAIAAIWQRLTDSPGWLIAALLPLIGLLPTLGHGVIDAADGPYHVHRIQAMAIMLPEGYLWPRWVPYFHLGFGYPIFNFYPPGVSYLGGLLVVLGLDAAGAFNAVAALAWVVGSVGMYALARQFLPAPGALLACMLWAYAPSRLHEVWYQGGLAQMMSAALMPWFFYGLALNAFSPSRRRLLAIALPLGGIILTHIPITFITALFGAPAALLLPLWAAYRHHPSDAVPRSTAARRRYRDFLRRLGYLAAGIALGTGLGAIFFVPMALELKYIRGINATDETISFLKARFLMLDEVFQPVHRIDFTDLNPAAPVTLGTVGGVLAFIGVIALLHRRRYALAALLTAALAFNVFMLLESSLDVWLAIPYFRQLRFPERLLRAGSIWVALLGGASLLVLPPRWRTRGLWIALPLALAGALPMVYGTNAFIRMDNLTALDEINFERTTRVWGTTSYDEYDPIWGEHIPLPNEVPNPEHYLIDPLRIGAYFKDVILHFPALNTEQIDTTTTRVTANADRAVRFHQYYYPGWQATLDGEPVEVYPEDELGLLTIDVPAGEHDISLRYTDTTAQRAGAIISAISVLVAGLLLLTGRPRHAPTPAAAPDYTPVRDDGLTPRTGGLLVAALLAFALVSELVIAPHTTWFWHESPPDDPAAMQTPVHQTFGGALELLGYTLASRTVAPGESLEITLFWRATREITTPYQPITQIVNLSVTEAWAASEQPFPLDGVDFRPDRFASLPHTLTVLDTAPLAEGQIMIQLIDRTTGQRVPLADGSTVLLLDRVRIEEKSMVERLMDW